MSRTSLFFWSQIVAVLIVLPASGQQGAQDINVKVPPIMADKDVKYDYDIVYVRVMRPGDKVHPVFAEVFHPTLMDPGGDLMLLRPDGSEERRASSKPRQA